jgi:membrane-associated phospholipid phosphatase
MFSRQGWRYDVPVMECPKCSCALPNTKAKYCPRCGAVIPAARATSPAKPLLGGLLLLALAATCDARVAQWVHDHDLRPALQQSLIAKIVKAPGDFKFTLGVMGLILITGLKHWRGPVALFISALLAGWLYTTVKWCVGRTRPFPKNIPPVPPFKLSPFHLGVQGLWKADNQAFPSGHACLAFATAATLSMIYPRSRVVFYLIAAMVGLERVLEGAHYPADVVAGAIFGILAAVASMEIVRRLFPAESEVRGFPVVIPSDQQHMEVK